MREKKYINSRDVLLSLHQIAQESERLEYTEVDPYIAHIKEVSIGQPVSVHNIQTGSMAEIYCTVEYMAPLAYLAGILHDIGKYSEDFQIYIKQDKKKFNFLHRGDVNHATAGGNLIEDLLPKSNLSELIQLAIYSHHGLYDAIDLKRGVPLIEKRQSEEYRKLEKIDIDHIKQRFYRYLNKEALYVSCLTARESLQQLKSELKNFMLQDTNRVYGNKDFYMGMHERLLLSLLIDADRSDTAEFMNGTPNEWLKTNESSKQIWRECTKNLEAYLTKLTADKDKTKISIKRQEISDICLSMADGSQRLYRLTLPTGSGKTLSGLRFALYHALKSDKKRIFYVAPFNSILEQNADEIRNAVGQSQIVLEHHCNVVPETQEEKEWYDLLTENWSSPIIATTAVQFLDTLFSSKTGCVRRLHSLCDSVIIFDEIQAIPTKVTSMLNLAVNYLTSFCNTTVVLCSATQPVLDKLPQNRLLPPKEIVKDYMSYDRAFRRVTLVDKTELYPGGMTVEALGEFVLEHWPKEKQILVVVNTKDCALNLYRYLKKHIAMDGTLYHLSTNMCVLNRRDVLKKMKTVLKEKEPLKPMICVSTQMIEAGVDVSFRCVIRSLAGLDNIIQAAGRCNRNGELEMRGNVFIVKMSKEAEKLSNLKEIRVAQEAMEETLGSFRKNPEQFDSDLLSDQAKEQYYIRYYQKRDYEVDYPVTVHGASTTLVDLLSANKLAQEQYCINMGKDKCNLMMKQAFKTAGELFQVISEEGKVTVIVEYNDDIIELIEEVWNPYLDCGRQRQILQQLQLASVGISEQMKNLLGNAIKPVGGGMIDVLSSNYYSNETGVSLEPVGMELLDY